MKSVGRSCQVGGLTGRFGWVGVELAEERSLRARCPQGGKQPGKSDCGWDPEALQLAPQAVQRVGEGEVGAGEGGNPGKE